MKTQFNLGKTYGAKNNEKTAESVMNNEYAVVIQEKSETKNLILLSINSRKNFIEKTTKFYGSPDVHFEEKQIRAMDILLDEICIKDNNTGTIIYGDAKMFIGENKIIQFTPIGNDLIANVQYEIETISGERLTGFLYCTHQPKIFYI
jgi:hypothetical protein